MPIYEYKCKSCNNAFEVLQKINERPLTNCSECSNNSLVKQVSAPSFRLKGSGWYETDFKKDKQRNLAKNDTADKNKENTKDKSKDKPQDKPQDKNTKSAESTTSKTIDKAK